MREISTPENLTADVEGDLEEVDGVMKITKIRLHYRMRIPRGKRETVERVLESYADRCPAYQSVKGCIECSWDMEMQEA